MFVKHNQSQSLFISIYQTSYFKHSNIRKIRQKDGDLCKIILKLTIHKDDQMLKLTKNSKFSQQTNPDQFCQWQITKNLPYKHTIKWF
jgi:hypothetical protein